MIKRVQKNEKGLTLLEVMVASFILALVALPLLSIFANSAKLVQTSYQQTNNTYKAKSLTEYLYGLTYPNIVPLGTAVGATPISADTKFAGTSTGKYYTLSILPAGPAGVVTGNTCYFHLVVSASGTAKFIGPNATSLASISASDLNSLSLSVTKSGTSYTLSAAGRTLASGQKNANDDPVVLLVNYSSSANITVSPASGSSFKLLAYCTADYPTANLTSTATTTMYNNDTPPTKLLLTAVLKTYATASSAVENVYQDTFYIPVGTMQ